VEDKSNGIVSTSKCNPCTGLCPEDFGRLRLPEAQGSGKVVSSTHRPPLPPRKYSCIRG